MTLADGVAAIDGTGRYLLPGLTDMHAHVFTADALVPYLANGVTTVRNMWGGPMALEMKEAVAEGRIPGPRIVTAGQLLDGPPKIWAGSTEVADTAEAAALVAQQAADGYDFVKVYSRLSPEVLDAILAAGAEHGIAVAGHTPQDVPLLHAVQGGLRSAEHFTGMLSAVFADPALPNPDLGSFDPRNHELVKALGRGDLDAAELVDPDKVAQLGADLAAHDFWLVPTIDVMKNFTSIPRPAHPDAFASPDASRPGHHADARERRIGHDRSRVAGGGDRPLPRARRRPPGPAPGRRQDARGDRRLAPARVRRDRRDGNPGRGPVSRSSRSCARPRSEPPTTSANAGRSARWWRAPRPT